MEKKAGKADQIKKNYGSPRWSMEIPDCSMPMTLDTYSKCAYNCLYCFAYFQKSHSLDGYIGGGIRSVDPEKIINLFEAAARNDRKAVNKTELQFFPYIQDRRIMQWGAWRMSLMSGRGGTASRWSC